MDQIRKWSSLNIGLDKTTVMNNESENLKKTVKDRSLKLAKLGRELRGIEFSYKIKEKTTKQYWQNRVEDFKRYNALGLEYYNQVYAIIRMIDEREAGMFLLKIGKFRQLGASLLELMEKIKENPSIMDSKGRQQSLWSRDIRRKITQYSDSSLQQERDMNLSFREFYENRLKKIL